MDALKYSIVVPVYNEEESIAELVARLRETMDKLDGPAEAVLVDDGSRDASYRLMLDARDRDPRFKVIQLSRNFGHQLAITAGMDHACGQAVVVMDADLQDPPQVILDLAAKWQEGYEVVYAVRRHRPGETRFKTATAATFYSLLRRLASIEQTVDVGDFRLVDRKALDAFLRMREHNRYVRGMFSWIGFRQAAVPYDREPRHAGTSKYPLRKMIKFAADAFVGFSTAPLRFALVGGFIIAVIAVGYGLVAIALKLAGLPYVPGYASLLVTIAFLSGVQLMVMGMVGQYVARVYDETKGRPLYLVRAARGFGTWDDFAAAGSMADGFQRPAAPGPGPAAAAGAMTASEADIPGAGASRTATVPRIAGAGQLAMRARLPGPALEGLLALTAYLAVFIIGYAFPLVRHPGVPQVGQSTLDPNFYIWSWRWWPYAISHGLNPLYSSQIGAPAGYNLAWTTPVPAVAVILSPVTAAFGPVTSFNLTLVLAAPVSAWAAFLAARRLTGRFWAALAAGAVYGFSWYEVAETGAGHPNLYVIMLLPLMVYLVLLWRDGKLGSGWFAGLMAVAMAAEFYVSNETFAGMTVLWAAGLLIGFALARPAQRQTVARLARLSGLAYAAAIAAVSPYLVYALRHSPPGFTKVQPAFSLNLESLVNPWSGIVLLVIVLALAVLTWPSRLTRLLVIGFVLIVALAIGPVLVIGARQFGSVPWERLWYLPVARSAEPLRLVIFAYLVLAIIVALWLALPVRNRLLLAARWILGLAAVAGIIAYVPTASRGSVIPAGTAPAGPRGPAGALPAFLTSGRYRDYLRPGEIVVVVSDRGNASMLFQADSDFYVRVAGGFINRSLSTATGLPTPVEVLRHPTPAREQQFRAYVRQAGVGAILVERAWSAPWMNVFRRMGLHGTPVGGVIVYPTG